MNCRCGAKWRVNYPFGRNGRGVVSFEREHKSYCRFVIVRRGRR